MTLTKTFSTVAVALALGLSGCGDSASLLIIDGPNIRSTPELIRSIDGSGNRADGAGQAFSRLLRRTPASYFDGISAPAGQARLSARAISNIVAAQAGPTPDAGGRSDFVWVWGQFVDHDISITTTGSEAFPIVVPTGDPEFDPTSTGTQTIGFFRSIPEPGTGSSTSNPRQHLNENTAFLDASTIYGSDDARAAALRTFSGGLLGTSAGDLPMLNTLGFPVQNPTGADPATLFFSGDVRANEHVALTALHALFIREHNYWATQLALDNPGWTDEQLYQRARKIVAAEIQVITYREFLPAILGPDPLPDYQGFQESVDPQIDTLFSTAAYRVGHTMVGTQLLRLQPNGQPIPEGNLPVRDAFFQPGTLVNEGGVDPLFRGLAANRMQTVDTQLVDDLRNFLFGPPGAGGFDLASLNIQRGRDHGLTDYNSVREAFGFDRVTQFGQITSDVVRQADLAAAYASVDDIDPWVGLLSEDYVPGSVTGPTLRAILIDQFARLRDGDRFYFHNDPSLIPLFPVLEATRLSQVIARNSGADLQDNVFFVNP
jgi:peroxidase